MNFTQDLDNLPAANALPVDPAPMYLTTEQKISLAANLLGLAERIGVNDPDYDAHKQQAQALFYAATHNTPVQAVIRADLVRV